MSVTFLARPIPAVDLHADGRAGAVLAYSETEGQRFLFVDRDGCPGWLPIDELQLFDSSIRKAVDVAAAALASAAAA